MMGRAVVVGLGILDLILGADVSSWVGRLWLMVGVSKLCQPYAVKQAVLRADLFATEKLLVKGKLGSIAAVLFDLFYLYSRLGKRYKNNVNYPTVLEEFNKIKGFLERRGYSIQTKADNDKEEYQVVILKEDKIVAQSSDLSLYSKKMGKNYLNKNNLNEE